MEETRPVRRIRGGGVVEVTTPPPTPQKTVRKKRQRRPRQPPAWKENDTPTKAALRRLERVRQRHPQWGLSKQDLFKEFDIAPRTGARILSSESDRRTGRYNRSGAPQKLNEADFRRIKR